MAATFASRVTEFRSSQSFIAFGICLAAFTETFLYGLIIPLLPYTLTRRIHLDEQDVQRWISALLAMYGVGSIAGSAVTGWVASEFNSTRTAYSLGLISLAASTIAFALGKDIAILLIGRLFQGVSSAAVWTAGLVILTETIDKEKSGRYMGFVNAAAALGYILGPVVGGLVYDALGYYPEYGVASLLVLIDIILRLAMLTPGPAKRKQRRTEGEHEVENGNASQRPQSPANGSKRQRDDPDETTSLLPRAREEEQRRQQLPLRSPTLALLTSPRMLAALLGSFDEHTILTGLEAVLPVFAKRLFGWTSSQIALLFLLLVAPTLLSPLVGRLSERFSARRIVAVGLGALAAPAIFCLRFIVSDQPGHVAGLAVLIGAIGVGVSLIMTPIMAEIASIVEEVQVQLQVQVPAQQAISDGEGGDTNNNDSNDTIRAQPEASTKARHSDEVTVLTTSKDATPLAYGMVNIAMMGAGIVGPLACGFLVDWLGWEVMTAALSVFCALSAATVWKFLGVGVGNGEGVDSQG